MMPAFKKCFELLGDDLVEMSTENQTFNNKNGSYDEKCLEESKAKLLGQIDDEKKANLLMFRVQKQMENQY